ncbi:MAG: hypothetical protein WAT79_13225 [Saprospiraceae bacterium]
MKKLLTYISILLFFSCNIEKWNLDDQSNKLIPNYSLTLEGLECIESFNTNIYALDKDNFVTAIEDQNNSIKIIKITQTLIGEKWKSNYQAVWNAAGTDLIGFDKTDEEYFITFMSNGWPQINKLDGNFNPISSFNSFESFIDTSYNDINSISFQKMIIDTSSGVYLIGQLSSFSKNYSCVLKMNTDLKPIYLKTYFENDTIQALHSLDNDRFIVLNQQNTEMALILDNTDGKLYQKYDLSFDEVFSSANLTQINGRLYLTGTISSGIGKTIEITLENKNAFISDVENYAVIGLTSFKSSRNTLLLSGVTRKEISSNSFLAEYKDRNYLWCNEYQGFDFIRSLSLTEAPDVGLLYLYLVKKEDRFYLHVIRTDEEGATIDNPYDLNCIQ